MGLYDFTFYDLITRNAFSYGERPAWFEVDGGGVTTFAGYKEEVDRLAQGLRSAGIQKGDRIAVLGKNCLEYFILYGAAAALGAIVLPINWRLSSQEMEYNLNDCSPRLLFAGAEYQDTITSIKERLPSVEGYINLEPKGGRFDDMAGVMQGGGVFEPAEVCDADGFVIIHTAAVAGRPRGALLSHGNVLCADMHFDYFCGLSSKDVHLNLLPLFHVGGLFMATSTFHAGALNVNMSKFDAVKAVELIQAKRVSFMFDFAPILASILEAQEKAGLDISSLRSVVGLEAPETIERYQRVTGGTFYCMYGQTETSCVASFAAYNDRPGSAGKMLPLARVQLVDDDDQPISLGQVGEITVKGPMVFKGYWNLPEDNQYTFRNGWHHTGDLGRLDEDGFLWYAGRKAEKELIKPGGENVYPAEVEKTILEHPSVVRTVVFGVPDPKWKEGIKAVCELGPGAKLSAQDLIDFVGQRIARYKKPQYVQFVENMPCLSDGKPDRAKVKALYGGA